MLDLGFQELIVIFAVAIIVFGPRKLPELSRNLGRGIGKIRKALFDVKYEINKEMRVLDEEVGVKPADSGEPKWKKEALEAIYGGKDPRGGGVQVPGSTPPDKAPETSPEPEESASSPQDTTEGPDGPDRPDGTDKEGGAK